VAEEKYTQRKPCPVCGRMIGLTGGGNIAQHNERGVKDGSGYDRECPGSGRKPA
jgi:hypothetical protein